MKVKELIEKLNKYDSELEILIRCFSGNTAQHRLKRVSVYDESEWLPQDLQEMKIWIELSDW